MHTVYFCRLVEEVFEGGLNLGDHLGGGHGTTAPHESETVTLTSQGARGIGSSDRRPVTPEKFTARQRKKYMNLSYSTIRAGPSTIENN